METVITALAEISNVLNRLAPRQLNVRRRNRSEDSLETRAEREQGPIGSSGRIKLNADRQTRSGQAGRQHQPWNAGGAAGRNVARDRDIESHLAALNAHRDVLSDRR